MTVAVGQSALEQMVVGTGRSWWQAGFADGKVVSEWDTTTGTTQLPARNVGHTSRWEELPKKGLRALRLLCPNGMVGHLETTSDHKLFQLKVGTVSFRGSRQCRAHLIGKIVDMNGGCELMAFEVEAGRLVGPIQDNVLALAYQGIGALALDNLELQL